MTNNAPVIDTFMAVTLLPPGRRIWGYPGLCFDDAVDDQTPVDNDADDFDEGPDEDWRYFRLVWTSLGFVGAALRQIERVWASWDDYLPEIEAKEADRDRGEPVESEQTRLLFWVDVHLLVICVHNLNRALRALSRNAHLADFNYTVALEPAFAERATKLRHLLEHWEGEYLPDGNQDKRTAWERMRDEEGRFAHPTDTFIEGPNDLIIGSPGFSISELTDHLHLVQHQLILLEDEFA